MTGLRRDSGFRSIEFRYGTVTSVIAIIYGAVIGYSSQMNSPSNLYIVVLLALVVGLFLLVASTETVFRCLMIALIFQNVFVVDIGVWILPAYPIGGALAVRLLVRGRFRQHRTPMDRAIRAFIIIAICSLPIGMYLASRFTVPEEDLRFNSYRPLIQFGVLVIMVSLYYSTRRMLHEKSRYLRAVKLYVYLGCTVAVYALYQQVAYYVGLPTLRSFQGLPTAEAGFEVAGHFVFRSNATFFEPLNLGHFLLGTLCLTFALFRGQMNIPVLVPLLQFLALVSTFSIGSYVGLAMAALVFALVRGRRRFVFASLVSLLVALALLGTYPRLTGIGATPGDLYRNRVLEAVTRETGASNAHIVGSRRIEYWQASVGLLRQFPLTGVGLGNFGGAVVRVDPRLRANAGSHGVFWAWIAEFGLWGLILFIIFIFSFVKTLLVLSREGGSRGAELVGFLAGFVAMMTQYLSYGSTRLDVHTWVYIGMAIAAADHARAERLTAHNRGSLYKPAELNRQLRAS